MSAVEKMEKLKSELITLGHEAKIPLVKIVDPTGKELTQDEFYKLRQQPHDNDSWVWNVNREGIKDHFVKITWSDAILVPNYEKDGVANYIGPNTLMEMGLALFLNKKIFLLNPIPDMPSKEEIIGVNPVILDGDLTKISK
jgi:hypothetical protein